MPRKAAKQIVEKEEVPIEKPKRGRKKAVPVEEPAEEVVNEPVEEAPVVEKPKRGRKKAVKEPVEEVVDEEAPVEEKPKRGRKKAVKEPVEGEEKKTSKRMFTLFSVQPEMDEQLKGRFTGVAPSQAAKKIFTKICQAYIRKNGPLEGPDDVIAYTFKIIEHGKDRTYEYHGERRLSSGDKEFERANARVAIKHDDVVKAVKKPSKQ